MIFTVIGERGTPNMLIDPQGAQRLHNFTGLPKEQAKTLASKRIAVQR